MHYLGRVFATFASITIGLPVYDTQCGFKVFNHQLAYEIFSKNFISKWIFDVELFLRAKSKDTFFKEIPLKYWVDISGSKLKKQTFYKHY